ncbi:CoA transferase subunit A [Ramlibacter sp. AN1133]|uniref:CoA transferase subunit A n=1 Tax=Ramlibacter sp. AN1133 TaxID=3133429 RepID=UPI0030BB5F5C
MISVEELASRIPDGAHLAVPVDFNAFFSGAAMEVTRHLIRAGRRNLRLLVMPSNGMQADILIGAGCVSELECGAMLMPELGTPPRFSEAMRTGRLQMRESTCPVIFHGLGAAEKGLPFIPIAGVIGSDVVRQRNDWKVVANPFDPEHDILLVPAIRPDVALFHAPLADRLGNVWLGRRRELAMLAHACRRTLVTVERIFDGDLMNTPLYEDGTLSNLYIDAIAHCPGGSWPLDAGAEWPGDPAQLRAYFQAARTQSGFTQYLQEVFMPGAPQ